MQSSDCNHPKVVSCSNREKMKTREKKPGHPGTNHFSLPEPNLPFPFNIRQIPCSVGRRDRNTHTSFRSQRMCTFGMYDPGRLRELLSKCGTCVAGVDLRWNTKRGTWNVEHRCMHEMERKKVGRVVWLFSGSYHGSVPFTFHIFSFLSLSVYCLVLVLIRFKLGCPSIIFFKRIVNKFLFLCLGARSWSHFALNAN